MSLLVSIENSEFTEDVVKLLNKNKYFTISEFLDESKIKLSRLTNISEAELIKIKRILREINSSKFVPALKIYQRSSTPVVTKINNLDSMLSDQLHFGSFVEICGLSSTGKSIFCSTVALNFAQYFDFESIYIDTKKDFSGTRIRDYLTARECAEETVPDIMRRIRVVKAYYAPDLLAVLKNLLNSKDILNKIKLLVIDSMPSIWFQYHGLFTEGTRLLLKVAQLLKKLANEHGILVIVVNLATSSSWAELKPGENIPKKPRTTVKPSLGKYWETVPTHRLIIEKLTSRSKNFSSIEAGPSEILIPGASSSESQRFIKILKSNCYETGRSCEVLLTDKGML